MDLEKHFLRQVVDLRAIRRHAVDDRIDQVLVVLDQFAERGVVAGATALDQRALVDILHPASSPLIRAAPAGFCFNGRLKQLPSAPV